MPVEVASLYLVLHAEITHHHTTRFHFSFRDMYDDESPITENFSKSASFHSLTSKMGHVITASSRSPFYRLHALGRSL